MFSNVKYSFYFFCCLLFFCLDAALPGEGACFFPTELQGEFIMQSTYMPDSRGLYSQLNITPEAIPIWGSCHRRIGNNVILLDSFSAANCIRCLQLTMRSRNVIQVKTEGLDKCYTSEDAAELTCPRDNDANSNNLKEILLYKTKEIGGEEIRKEYCPIHGRFSFNYFKNDGFENKYKCDDNTSELHTCSYPMPAASLNMHFKSCTFNDNNITFTCLGDWQGPGNQRYLALHDTTIEPPNGLQYRCAMYHIDPVTGKIYIAFSSDSTCSNNLVDSTHGFETMVLDPFPEHNWPQKIQSSSYRFPNWTQGNWQHMFVNGNLMTYRDHSSFQTLKIKIIGPEIRNSERFLVYIRDQCGGGSYNCIWLKRRNVNVLEFQLGINPSAVYNDSVCHNSNFQTKVWITQGRLDRIKESPCPITGRYTGFIPEETGLCAKLSSDCKSPEIMYYTLSDCSQKEVYEEREYRCLGQWQEKNLTYTYTQRSDTGIYECFVGLIVSENEIYIKEAGEHCERDVEPVNRGMKLSLEGSCSGSNPNPVPKDGSSSHTYTQRPPTEKHRSTGPPHVTKPWELITAPPRIKNEVLNSGSMNVSFYMMILLSCIFSLIFKEILVHNENRWFL